MSGRSGETDVFLDLVDEFCSGLIDEVGFERLESILLASREARDDFAEYVAHHAMIRATLGSRRAAGGARKQIDAFEIVFSLEGPSRSAPPIDGGQAS
jgi:hypothetical protein